MLTKIYDSKFCRKFCLILSLAILLVTIDIRQLKANPKNETYSGYAYGYNEISSVVSITTDTSNEIKLVPADSSNSSNSTAANAASTITLPAGTQITLETIGAINTTNFTEGQEIKLRVSRDVVFNGSTVILSNSVATGRIVSLEKPRMFGRPGKLEIKLESVKAIDDQTIALSGNNKIVKGKSKQTLCYVISGVTVVLVLVLVGVFLIWIPFLIKGGHAEIPSMTELQVATAQSTQISTTSIGVQNNVPQANYRGKLDVTLYLNNKNIIKGNIVEETGDAITIIRNDGSEITYNFSEVQSVTNNYERKTVTFKNDNKVIGIITEQSGSQIKVELVDGSVMNYKLSEIRKIEKK